MRSFEHTQEVLAVLALAVMATAAAAAYGSTFVDKYFATALGKIRRLDLRHQ